MPKHSSSILDLARRGAEVRWNELQSELSDLFKAFPDLRNVRSTATAMIPQGHRGLRTASNDSANGQKTRRGKMSPAARRAVSSRMKKYWAARRREKKS
jgi:hypothetical protein